MFGDSMKKPKMRLDHLRGVMTRHDDMMRVFNRRQRETIRRVEHVFESSHRQIDTVLIGHRISNMKVPRLVRGGLLTDSRRA